MISLEEAKRLIARYYLLPDQFTVEDSTTLNDFAKHFTYPDLYDDMRADPKYKTIMPLIEVKKEILKDTFLGIRDN